MQVIPNAPTIFKGSLKDLYDKFTSNVLLDVDEVYKFHHKLVNYLISNDMVFLIRTVAGLDRETVFRNQQGNQINPTDNAPAWWIHYQLFSRKMNEIQSFAEFISQVPTKMFNIGLSHHINKAGWYVAHIFNAKDGRTNYNSWGRTELTKRMLRNIHPCNYFYFPKTGEPRSNKYGEDPKVICYFRDQYAIKYKDIWDEFMLLIGEDNSIPTNDQNNYFVEIPVIVNNQIPIRPQSIIDIVNNPTGIKCVYSHSRLCFLADKIEPLAMDDKFQINSKAGIFIMTKHEFYDCFPNVVKSTSYQRDRIYHYSSVPQKALRFKV